MGKKFQKIGENLIIKNIIIHQLLKDAGKRCVNAKSAIQVLNIGERERLFLGNLDVSYNKKSNPIYGIFSGEYPEFKHLLNKYIEKRDDFYNFSMNVMNHYKRILEQTVQATGGYMILCEYTKLNKDLLLVLMINNKEGFVVNDSLTLDNVRNLDLNKVDVACLINLTDWADIENNNPTDRITYLSFVKGLKEVSYYFMQFIDVDNKSTSEESTKKLLLAIEEYAGKEGWDRNKKMRIKEDVVSYCIRQMDGQMEILLSDISAIMEPDHPEKFQDFATEDGRKVSAVISGNRQKLRLSRMIKYKNDDLKLEFATKLILGENKTIHYDEKTNKLTIKEVPNQLKQQILELINGTQ